MENLLLVWDEIDDVFSIFRALWPPIASFLMAIAGFIVTGLLALYVPLVVIAASALLLVVGYVMERNHREPAPAAVKV